MKDRVEAVKGFFSLYAKLLSVEACTHWDKIVDRQICVSPWTDLKGCEQCIVRTKTYKSFLDCTKHHLLTIFNYDTTEQQKFYISNVLKKLPRVAVRAFFTHVEQLNSFIALLLSLWMCPDSWQNQYNLSQETILKDSHRLLIVLENIEKLGVTATATQKPAANSTGNTKFKSKSDTNRKCKGPDSSVNQSNKKNQTEKH